VSRVGRSDLAIYLASPIDQVQAGPIEPAATLPQMSGLTADFSGGAAEKAYAQARVCLYQAGVAIYDPKLAWSAPAGDHELNATIGFINEEALGEADGVLAVLPDGVPSVGVPIEIATARYRSKPVVVFGGPIVARSPVLSHMGVPVRTDAEEAITLLLEWITGPSTEPPFDPPEAREAAPPGWVAGASGSNRETRGEAPRGAAPAGSARPASLLVDGSPDALGYSSIGLVDAFLTAVALEVKRAASKFPDSDRNTIQQWVTIWLEEVIEAVQAINDNGGPKGAWEQVSQELVQASAMGARLWVALHEGEDR